MNYNEKGSKDEMSMEVILSSIRKYVAEDDGQDADKKASEASSSSCSSTEDVISLSASQVKEDTVSGHTDESLEDLSVYQERSTLSTGVVTNNDEDYRKRQSPFEQLTNALNAYGKHKREGSAGAKTVDQLFSEIAERIVQRWVDVKMESFVEKIVMREIEKIKAE